MKHRYKFGFMTLFLVGLTTSILSTSVVLADEVSEAQNALDANKAQSNDLNQQIQDQENKVAQLNNQVANKTLEISKTQKNISANQAKLAKLDTKITKTQKEVKQRRQTLQSQLVNLQKQSNKSALGNVYADFILSGSDLSDIVSRAVAVQKINTANHAALTALTDAQQKLQTFKDQQQTQQAALVNAKQQLETEKAKLDTAKLEATNQQTQLQNQLNANQAATSGLQDQLKAAQDKQAQIEAALKAAQAKAAQTQTATANQQTEATSAATTATASGADLAANNSDYQAALNANLPSSAANNKIIQDAMQYLGVPYVWGGTTPAGFDCSGLVYYCYKLEGKTVPRVSQGQSTVGQYVSLNNLQPGDLLFWGGVGTAHHVAIYIGNGQYIHAPQPGENVKIGSIAWFRPDFGRRY
ncbi:C40 family peptidase [Lactobacillus sp. CC-MHH1034]|uniref:C40 family peptidase n=1 Tax=Agrilactobacillus fermenti TaxID=2586909 RepID=UPI001E4E821E|nr:C40 family peptidase [Agrilactobacillus fermenti]MCD2256077.1 C40 family peptidase [Agrilactobacillus fermenti]